MRGAFLILTLLFYFSIQNISYSYPNNRPTEEAVIEDSLYCAPMWGALGVCSAFLFVPNAQTMAACGVGLSAYCNYRNSAVQIASAFRDATRVNNHRDLDENFLNDFSYVKDTKCEDLLGKTVHLGQSDVETSITVDHIKNFDGCKVDDNDKITGDTYELYDHSKKCSGIRIDSDIDSVCIEENDCKTIEYDSLIPASKLVCAYEMDQLICADGVFCSMNIAGGYSEGINSTSDMQNIGGLSVTLGQECVDFSAINGRINNGFDDYITNASRVVNCSDVCKIKESVLEVKEEYEEYIDYCKNIEICSIGEDQSSCIEGGDCGNTNAKVINGFFINPKLYAHCIPKYNEFNYHETPRIISAYCSNKAKVRNIYNENVDSFSGRAMRCIDQTIKNVFYGGYEVIEDKKVKNYQCLSDNRVVSSVIECNDGAMAKFHNLAKNIVSVILVLSIGFIGVLVLIGGFSDIKKAAQYFLKFAIVLYFVYGNAWSDSYSSFFYNVGTTLGEISFNSFSHDIGEEIILPKNRKCSSGDVDGTNNEPDLVGPNQILYNNILETRFKVWDSFDCRWRGLFSRGTGIGEISIVELLSENFPSLVFYAILLLIIAPITVGIFILIMLKTMFAFVSSMIVVSLLIFISPLIIPLILFHNSKLRGLFDQWLKNLIGFSLVPMILLMVLAIFFKTTDYAIYGYKNDAIYHIDDNNGRVKKNDDCRIVYIPCILHKYQQGDYDKNPKGLEIVLAYLHSSDFTSDLMLAIFRLFFIFAVMYLVFSYISKTVINKILGVDIMSEDIFNNISKAASMAGSIGVRVANNASKKLSNLAQKARKQDTGKKDNYDVE